MIELCRNLISLQSEPIEKEGQQTGERCQENTSEKKDGKESDKSDNEEDENFQSGDEYDIEQMPETASEMDHEIRNEQRNEEGWNKIIAYLTGREKKANKRLRNVASKFTMKRGLLYRIDKGEAFSKLALVVPTKMRALVLHNAHDARISGHQGILRTYRRLRGRYYWNTMLEDVKTYVGSCVTCASMKGSKTKPMGEMQLMRISEIPFRRIAIDKFGQVQNSTSGHKYVIIAVDTCTRYVIAKAIRDAKAKTAAKFMRKIILEHFPVEVLSDNGSEFAAEFSELLQYAGIKHYHSTSRHPRTNGMVERANQSISQIMRTLIAEKRHEDWAEALPYAVSSYNSGVHEVTGFSPRFLLYGVETHVGNLLHESNAEVGFGNGMDIREARKLAGERTRKQQLRDKRRYDRKRRPVSVEAGDFVMVEIETSRKGQSKRFNPRRQGPFRVVEKMSNNTVRIIDRNDTETTVNVERCIRIQIRPAELEKDDGVDDVIDNIVRGPDLNEEGSDQGRQQHETENSTDRSIEKTVERTNEDAQGQDIRNKEHDGGSRAG